MSILFFVAFAFSRMLALVLPSDGTGGLLASWLTALTTNPVLDLAAGGIYVAATLHLVVGVLWGVAYAALFEPRLSGSSWRKGILFSLLPWALSLIVFFPIVGGGPLGLAIGAGPLPIIGNLILHLVFGATLGVVYGPLGDIPADQFPNTREVDSPWVIGQEEQAMGRGIVGGALVGTVVGLGIALMASASPDASFLGAPPIAGMFVSIVLGATFGCFIGSMVGLGRAEAASQPR
jgi:hypothetical protein